MIAGSGASQISAEERTLQQEIQEKAVLLSELEMMIMDYQREREGLLAEIRQLREKLWKLRAEHARREADAAEESSAPRT